MNIAEDLRIHASKELARALAIAGRIDRLVEMPTVTPLPVTTSVKAEEIPRFDLDIESRIVADYRVRVRQCQALGEYADPENIRRILVQEQGRQIDLATALGVDVPDVATSN